MFWLPASNRKKRKLWEVDPSIFQPGPKASRFTRFIVEPARTIAKFLLYSLFMAYPLSLVIIALLFGGLVFWGAFAGSVALIGLVLWRLGFAKNYEAWNPSVKRQLIGISGGFLLAVGFFLGFTSLNIMIPVVVGLMVVTVILLWKRSPF